MGVYAQAERAHKRRPAAPAGAARSPFARPPNETGTADPPTLGETLNDSPRVAAQLRIGRALNEGPRAVAQAKFAAALSAPVQRQSDGSPAAARSPGAELTAPSAEGRAEEAAGRGGGETLPHAEALRQSFGAYFPQDAQAHTGPEAVAANLGLGTGAVTYGESVLFAGQQPTLGKAAHEAAHVVQQQLGLADSADTGELEAQADAVARRAAKGESAVPLFEGLAQRKARAPVRPFLQADTGLLRPDQTGFEYVRIDVDGDGSCLFYSTFLSSVAATMLEDLRGENYRNFKPDQIAELVAAEAARVLGVERDDLRAALVSYQRRERETLAEFWRANLDVGNYRQQLRGDVRGLIVTYLGRLRLGAALYQQAALQPVSGVASSVRSSPKPDVNASGMEDEPGGRQDVAEEVEEEFDFPFESEESSLGAVEEYLKGASEPRDESVEEHESESESPSIVGPSTSKSSPPVKPETFKPVGFDYGKLKLAPFLTQSPGLAIRGVGQSPVGQGVRANSPLDLRIRELVLRKMSEKLLGNAPLLFNGTEFGDDELDQLIDAYIDEFVATRLYAGEAALAALRARHGLGIQTHIYQDSSTRVAGVEDPDQPVNVLETPNHFQVLVGPFVAGHLLPNQAAAAEESWEEEEEGTGAGTEELPEEFASQFVTKNFDDNLLGVRSLGIGVREDGNMTIFCDAGRGQQSFVSLLKKRVDSHDPLREPLMKILAGVEEFVEGKPLSGDQSSTSEPPNPFAELLMAVQNLKQRIERLELPADLTKNAFKVGAHLSDAEFIFEHEGVIYTQDVVPLLTLLEAVQNGPLSRGKTHEGAALVNSARELVGQAQDTWRAESPPPDRLNAGLQIIAERLREIALQLRVNSLGRATRVQPMPRLELPFRVFYPTSGKVAMHLKSTKGKIKFDRTGTFDLENFVREVWRQAAVQQKYLNRMTIDEWMLNRDMFNLKVAERRGGIMGGRSASYLRSISDTLLERNAEIGEQMGNRGNVGMKKRRIGSANEMMKGQIEATDAFSYMMNRQKLVSTIRGGGRRYDPKERPDGGEIIRLLNEILGELYATGKETEEGEAIESMVARDLVGRANPQSKWKKANVKDLLEAIRKMFPQWRGLIPNLEADPLRGLAVLHNPDQVAGGEREIPSNVEDITEFIGPGVVNSALGATWGLTEQGGAKAGSTSNRLEAQIRDLYPEACWPLFRMNVVLLVEIVKGSHETPQKGNWGGKRKQTDGS